MSVAMKTASTVATMRVTDSGQPVPENSGASHVLNAGSSRYPVRSVVSVMPNCALERCVEVILRAPIVQPRFFSPRDCRTSRSDRSRLTSANSLATKKPVPTVSTRPTTSMIHSATSADIQ
jgi:hypothetical protein